MVAGVSGESVSRETFFSSGERNAKPKDQHLGHGLGHGAGICPVEPMMLMIAPALPPGWLTGMGFPGVGPGVGIGPLV